MLKFLLRPVHFPQIDVIDPLHHFHIRKKTIIFFRRKAQSFVDKSIYIVSVLFPMLTLPQIWQIYSTQNSSGLSFITWGGYLIGTFFWLSYGYLHHERPIILTQILWLIIYSLVLIGIILY